ncbi:MAG: adenylyl-sulfate kinase [Candidatus Latescibacteria bacterium]|nr:adenylyl-sulfate kinase [bacterium]MBD3424866.1 adenylyl-sulfate kinase [Candidatus Latescibacterota bacterium]
MYKETSVRSVMKTISWRFLATLTTFSLVWIFTGKIDTALTVGGLEVIIKMIIYFFHERGWNRIKWGRKHIEPFVVWITGLSGSGKTEVARIVTEKLREMKINADHLDGETIRDIFPRTGFSRDEVTRHIERVGLLASRLEKNGVFVVASFISPFSESREFVRSLCNNFIEIHLATPMEYCEKLDHNNLYSRARAGEIRNLAGVDVEYEAPEDPDLILDISRDGIEQTARKVNFYLKKFM